MLANVEMPQTLKSVIEDLSITIWVVLLLSSFFLLRYFPLPVSSDTLGWLFVAQSNPSPAWILAILLHENIFHLVGNVGQFLYFGIVPERRLSTIEYVGFLVVTGVITTLLQVVQYLFRGVEGGMAGASGASMSVMGFTVAYIGLYYFGQVDDPEIYSSRFAIFAFGIGWAIIQTISDFYPGWTLAADASGIAHLSGFLLGTVFAYLKIR